MCSQSLAAGQNDIGFVITNLILSQKGRFTPLSILSQYRQIVKDETVPDETILRVIEDKMGILVNYGKVRRGIMSSVCA